jgi:2-polyprenyl-3-methyl-5-hydroxy-6-metoxy-1,4-benzoquinol methylase
MAADRDANIARDPIYRFEQAARQEAVLALLDAKVTASVIDVGCGNARDLSALRRERPDIQLTGVDISGGMLREGRSSMEMLGRSLNLVVGDASHLPFRSGTFDCAICTEVVEHVPNWRTVIDEIARILRHGGRMVLTTPNRRGLYGLDRATLGRLYEWFRPSMHPYDEWRAPVDVEAALAAAGLRVVERRGVCYLPGYSVPYRLPSSTKNLLVRIVGSLDPLLGRRLPRLGYMFAVAALRE